MIELGRWLRHFACYDFCRYSAFHLRKETNEDSPQKPQKDKQHRKPESLLWFLSFCEVCGESLLVHLKTAVRLPRRRLSAWLKSRASRWRSFEV